MKILVTGGAGFIGTNFVSYFLSAYPNDEVIVLDHLTYAGNAENLQPFEKHPRFRFVKGDICDAVVVDDLVKQVDAVVHIAAETHVDRSIQDVQPFIKTNILGTQMLLDACRRHGNKRFHHVSTDEVFGSLGPRGFFTETTSYDPRNPYSATKAASDHLVRAAWYTHQLPVTISNASNNYGPYCFPEKLIPLAITNAMEQKKIPLYGDGMQIREWLFVEDHCRGIDAVLRRGRLGETYCLGSRNERTNAEVLALILFEMGLSRDMMQPVADRPGHDRRYAMDSRKIETELGWSAETPFIHGLRKTIDWYKTHREWWQRIKSGSYKDYYQKQYGVREVPVHKEHLPNGVESITDRPILNDV